MASFTMTLPGAAATARLGLILGAALPPGAILCLNGELGSGKTTLVKSICEAMGIPPQMVTSPTYTLVNIYPARPPVFHVDLYRLSDSGALDDLDPADWLNPDGPTLIEWPALAREVLAEEPVLDLWLHHVPKHPDWRKITVAGDGGKFEKVFQGLKKL